MSGNGNGSILYDNPRPWSDAQQTCVDLLAEVLQLAREGKIDAVGIVACLEDGIATVMAGHRAGDLNLGCDNLKTKIHAAIFEDGNVARARGKSAIIRQR